MPHLTLEFSANVFDDGDVTNLMTRLHRALVDIAGFRLSDLKSQVRRCDPFVIGDASGDQAFVNLDIRTFAGKTAAEKRAIAECARAVLAESFNASMEAFDCDLSVQITEIDRESYARLRPKVEPHVRTATS